MQTFLPLPSFEKSVKCLDNKRLNKQIVECYQILKVLHGETKAWANHPAVLMWKGYERALVSYGIWCCWEYTARNHKLHATADKIKSYFHGTTYFEYPQWFGLYKFHESHRSNLYRKDPVHYKEFKEDYNNVKAYCWPLEVDGELIMRYKVAGEKKYLEDVK